MLWFKHQSGATNDAKLKKLIIRHGAVGYAVYFHCLELITGDFDENNITFELEHDSEIIADNLKIKGTAEKSGVAVVEEIMMTIVGLDLFTEANGHIHCFKLLKNIDTSMTSNPKLRAMITEAKENHDKVMIHHDGVMQDKTRLDKNRKEEKREEYPQDSHPLILATLLMTEHQRSDQRYTATPATLQKWAKDIDKLMRLDGRSADEVEAVIRWCQTPGGFWVPNILSGSKLREKFPTLLLQSKQSANGVNLKVHQRTTSLDMEE